MQRFAVPAMFGAFLTACTGVIPAAAQTPFSPPASSATVVAGIPFASGTPVGDRFRRRFTECDSGDTCDGATLRHGCRNDLNRNSTLLRLPGSVLFFDGKMGLDADGSPLSKTAGRGATDQPETSFRYPQPGRPSVDSDKVPFIVIPGGGFAAELGVSLGDIAAVVSKDRVIFALVADEGPTCKLGEGSIQLHEKLGHRVCLARNAANECTRLRDTSIERDVLYFIFAGSKSKIITGLTAANVNERIVAEGTRLLAALRGSR